MLCDTVSTNTVSTNPVYKSGQNLKLLCLPMSLYLRVLTRTSFIDHYKIKHVFFLVSMATCGHFY